MSKRSYRYRCRSGDRFCNRKTFSPRWFYGWSLGLATLKQLEKEVAELSADKALLRL